jgi:hypothetical protein
MDPQKKNRWGMLGISTVTPIERGGVLQKSKLLGRISKQLQWESFDHSKTLNLTESGATSIVYQWSTHHPLVLRSCAEKDYTSQKRQLVEFARANLKSEPNDSPFLSIECVFKHGSKYFVGSELSDISLEDIIECSIPLEEEHLSTILCQVRSSRCHLWYQMTDFYRDRSSSAGSV